MTRQTLAIWPSQHNRAYQDVVHASLTRSCWLVRRHWIGFTKWTLLLPSQAFSVNVLALDVGSETARRQVMTSENRPQSLFSVDVSANIVSTKFTWGHVLCHNLWTC